MACQNLLRYYAPNVYGFHRVQIYKEKSKKKRRLDAVHTNGFMLLSGLYINFYVCDINIQNIEEK